MQRTQIVAGYMLNLIRYPRSRCCHHHHHLSYEPDTPLRAECARTSKAVLVPVLVELPVAAETVLQRRFAAERGVGSPGQGRQRGSAQGLGAYPVVWGRTGKFCPCSLSETGRPQWVAKHQLNNVTKVTEHNLAALRSLFPRNNPGYRRGTTAQGLSLYTWW